MNIPKAKENQFIKKGIESVGDLIRFFPRKYYDFRNITLIKDIIPDEYQSVEGVVKEIKTKPNAVVLKVEDKKASIIYITFFHQSYIAQKFTVGESCIFCGKVNVTYGFRKFISMANPVLHGPSSELNPGILPVYSKIKGMSDDYLKRCMSSAYSITHSDEYLENSVIRKFDIISFHKALQSIHFPKTMEDIEVGGKRFLFDELFFFNLNLLLNENNQIKQSDFEIEKFEWSKQLMDSLPFELTEGQRNALRMISKKMKNNERVNALIQGDVGCGKTMVAIFSLLIAVENGYQGALMCPTSVLAKQHYEEITERFSTFGINVAYLSGDLKVRERKKVIKAIKEGEVDIVVGTHAVLGKDVEFQSLALTIVDEEHRFGVKQRELLQLKANNGVHTISMSATPIPRSLAMTIHGDSIDVMNIKSLPKGRKPVETTLITAEEDSYQRIYEEVQNGRQAYVVCPLVEESSNDVLKDVESVDEAFAKTIKYFEPKGIKVGMATGKMRQQDIDAELEKFANKEYDIFISTTIIEVGVNVPNATVILIKNAERFGLAQLHQLRGRVGRGSYQSYCLLLSEKATDIGRAKLETMCNTTDGFIIAEKDLELRGTGDFIGTSQSGQNKYVMLMLGNADLNESIRNEVKDILKNPIRTAFYKHLLKKEE
ncbi:ATP-dependent DNA helicase RecG [Bacillus mobilis]|uniref:ATP-dependent DNA helicase RecG n=1 Tax=Bacillus mobilis TaxID=2026190 RepID=UPI002E23DFC4|nr:ATP-dependent DNA helicase RecG [Bacillus mobilis]